jgi:hypothetical protein
VNDADDRQWRRPSTPEPEPALAPPTPPQPVYTGPPRGTPPPPDWRPRTLVQVPPPRQLPAQDEAALDEREQQSRTITYGVGMVAGAILLIVLFIVCGRALL